MLAAPHEFSSRLHRLVSHVAVGGVEATLARAAQAGDLYSHLQHVLFAPPGQNAQQIQQQYAQLVQSYDQHRSQGQITGAAATALRHALEALGASIGTG